MSYLYLYFIHTVRVSNLEDSVVRLECACSGSAGPDGTDVDALLEDAVRQTEPEVVRVARPPQRHLLVNK